MKNRPALWAIVGVVAALVISPVAAVAATSLVTITGGGNKAWVDEAHRLLSAESDPDNLVNTSASVPNGNCNPVYTVPAGKELVVKTMDFVAPATSVNSQLKVYPNGSCTGEPIAGSQLFFGSGCCDPADHVDFGAGAVVKPGQVLSVKNNNTGVDVYVHGYFVPSDG